MSGKILRTKIGNKIHSHIFHTESMYSIWKDDLSGRNLYEKVLCKMTIKTNSLTKTTPTYKLDKAPSKPSSSLYFSTAHFFQNLINPLDSCSRNSCTVITLKIVLHVKAT